MAVPLENPDIHLGQSISLDPADLFRRIDVERRGRCCFEPSALFALLPDELGFPVTRLAVRVSSWEEGVRPLSHQLLMVDLGTRVGIVGAGFGFMDYLNL